MASGGRAASAASGAMRVATRRAWQVRTPCRRALASWRARSPPASPECLERVLPFDARFLEALDLKKVSDRTAFERAAADAFDQLDLNGDGSIDRSEAEELLRNRIFAAHPRELWVLTPDQLLEKLGGTETVSREAFNAAVERIAETLDPRVWPLAQSQFFSAVMFALHTPLLPLLVKELGIGMAQFGGVVALTPLIRVALAFPATFMANRFGRKPLTVEGQLIAALGFGFTAVSATPLQLVLSRLVMGAGTSFATVGQHNMLGDIATGRTRARIFAPGATRAALAFAVGPALGGWLGATVGARGAYLMVGAGMAAVSLRNHFILTETLRAPSSPTQPGGDWARVARLYREDKRLQAVTLAYSGFNFTAVSAKFVLLPMLALEGWGLGAPGLGAALGSISLMQSLASRPAAHLADTYGRELTLVPGLGFTVAALAIPSAGLPPTAAVPLVCTCWALGAALFSSAPSALTLDATARGQLGQQETSRAMAVSRVMGDVGMATGALASGVLLEWLGVQEAFAVQAGMLGLVAVAAAAMLRRI